MIVVEQSGTLGQLEAFLYAHSAELRSVKRNPRGIWVAVIEWADRRTGEVLTARGNGLSMASALAGALEKCSARAAGTEAGEVAA